MQELSNLLWAFVKFRYIPRRLFAALEARLGDPELSTLMQSCIWAVLVRAAETPGVELQEVPYAALLDGNALDSFNAADHCNMLWCGPACHS